MRVVPHRSHNEVRWIRVCHLRKRRVEDKFHCEWISNKHIQNLKKQPERLTGTIDPRDQVKAIRRKARRRILEVANRARRVIQPCINPDTALRRQREREVLSRPDFDLRVDEVRGCKARRCELLLGYVRMSTSLRLRLQALT